MTAARLRSCRWSGISSTNRSMPASSSSAHGMPTIEQPPGPADFPSAKPWRGYSVKAFQADVLTRPLTSYRIDPMQPLFQGPVFVLTSARSISAAEIAADALKSTGRAKIIGEKTPGAVLSSKLFDIPGGFHLRVPIADYYSIKNGRLEGVGVTPDIPVSADQALEVALGRVAVAR